jgi:hypothetical protein
MTSMLEVASKHCFFEKKQQKTFAPLSRGCGNAVAHAHGRSKIKFFCTFLFTKISFSAPESHS